MILSLQIIDGGYEKENRKSSLGMVNALKNLQDLQVSEIKSIIVKEEKEKKEFSAHFMLENEALAHLEVKRSKDLTKKFCLKGALRLLKSIISLISDDYDGKLVIPVLWIQNKAIVNLIHGHFKEFQEGFSLKRLCRPSIYRLEAFGIGQNLPLVFLMLFLAEISSLPSSNSSSSTAIGNAFGSSDGFLIDRDLFECCLDCIKILDVPFYVRFKISELLLSHDEVMFEAFKASLQWSKGPHTYTLEHGGTAHQRHQAIKKVIMSHFQKTSFSDIVDVGCGMGEYIPILYPIIEPLGFTYHAVDISSYALRCTADLVESMGWKNVKLYPNISDVKPFSPNPLPMILCTEVIEHMPLDVAGLLITQVLERFKFSLFMLTTPDKAFNKYYNLSDNQMRHSDHDWEMTHIDFIDWIKSLPAVIESSKTYNMEFGGFGHSVDNVFATQYVIFYH